MIKKIFSHTAIYGVAPQVPKIASLLVLPIITQDLTSTDYGVLGVVTAFTGAISVLSQLGLRVILINSFYHSPGQYKWAWRQIYGFLILWNFFYSFILAGVIAYAIPEEAYNHFWSIIVLNVLPVVFFGPTAAICQTYYQVVQKPIQIGARSAIFGLVTIALNVLFITGYKMGYMGWFWASFLSGILLNFSFWYPLNFKVKIKPIFNFKWKYLKRRLKISLPTVPHYYSSYLLDSSDKMIMEFSNVGTANIGKYNFAYIIGNIFQKFGMATGKAIGPMMNVAYKTGKDTEAKSIIFFLQSFFFLATFTVSLWMKEIFAVMVSNPELENLYPLAIIIMMGYNYRPMYMGANSKLFFLEKTNILWKVTLVAGIINVFLNIILIPLLGYKVAAVTTFISFMFMGYVGFYLPAFTKINTVNYYPFLWLLSTILISISGYYAVELPLLLKGMLTSLSAIIGYIIFKKFQQKLGDA